MIEWFVIFLLFLIVVLFVYSQYVDWKFNRDRAKIDKWWNDESEVE